MAECEQFAPRELMQNKFFSRCKLRESGLTQREDQSITGGEQFAFQEYNFTKLRNANYEVP